jgi:hypothetical protein
MMLRGIIYFFSLSDCLCGLVVRVPGYRSRGPGFNSRRYQIFWEVVGLERATQRREYNWGATGEEIVAAPV